MSATIVLMVAEKPSICNSIAKALSSDLQSRGKMPPVHEFHGTFRGQHVIYRVTSVTGHVFSLDFPAKYQNWDSVDPIDLFSAPTIHSAEGKGGMVKHLEREARGVQYLVLWLDCDREGENICYEVIRCVESSMGLKKHEHRDRVFRARFSAVTKKDIDKAMLNLVQPNENEAKAVDARQELDLKVGVAFSRFQTRYFQGRYGNLDSAIISYGPCQTPTLGFCVDRYDEIQSFVPEPFWCIDAAITVPSSSSSSSSKVDLEWARGRLFDQTATEVFLQLIRSSDSRLHCEEVKASETRRTRPDPLNTVEFLKLASKLLGIGPQAAMQTAEHLYLSGYVSYPRTESSSYPSSFDFVDTLQQQRGHPEWGRYADQLLSRHRREEFPNLARKGVDVGDHPPITPVSLARPQIDLTGDEERVYALIVKHFLATISGDAIYLSTKVRLVGRNSGEVFTAHGKQEVDPGYLLIYDYVMKDNNSQLPAGLRANMTYDLSALTLREGRTTAPGPLTESELIGMMEKHGIGTDASIATHITNILQRNYVALQAGRTLVPTELGVVLVHGYQRIDPDLVLPQVRAAIEAWCDLVAQGKADKDTVVQHSLGNFVKKYQHFSSHIGAMDSLFEAVFSPLAATGKALSKCGKCLRYMRYIPLKPQRLHCPTCEETYSLPQNGTIKLYKELRCPLDQFELLLFSLGNSEKAQGKAYPICPYCYNHPPDFTGNGGQTHDTGNPDPSKSTTEGSGGDAEDPDQDDEQAAAERGAMGCNSCAHPTCKHSAAVNAICICPAGCGGQLVFDITSKPNWKLACNSNSCNTLLRFKADIHNIAPMGINCSECGSKQAAFEFNKNSKTKLPSKAAVGDSSMSETNYSGCIVCDDFLNSLTEIIGGRTINLTVLRQIRHRRGAGGRGRGRGRGRGGRPKGDVKMSFSDF